MGTLIQINAAISSPPSFWKPKPIVKAPSAVCCFRKKNGEVYGLSKATSQMESDSHTSAADFSQKSNVAVEMKDNHIWRLFREAQQNILYLNRLRLAAVQELNKTNKEKQLLLNKIEQLEAETKGRNGKDNLSICWELLLRIDSMVLTGLINTGEASKLRRVVKDHKLNVADVFSEIPQKKDAELLAGLRRFSDGDKKNNYHIVHICTEMAPLVSVGPLASYVTGLSRALQKKGHLVEVILPKYANLNLDEVPGLREIEAECYSYFNGQLHGNKIWTGVVHGIGVTFIEPVYYSSFFSRERLYGYPDDFERFTYFSRASLDYIIKSGKQPDVLHVHNWETAIVGPLFWDIFVKQGLGATRILLTCHGFDSQCLEQPNKLALCGLDPLRLHRPDRLQDNVKIDLVNILKGGLVYSNKVVIVSSMHSKGRIIRSLSHGLEPTLAIHKDKLLLAPSGFDCSAWDPSTDTFLPKNYSAQDMRGKAVCKVALRHGFGFSGHASATLVGCIFSEVSDPDLDNLKAVIWGATRTDVQFIFMGISKVPSINKRLESFHEEFRVENVRFVDQNDEALSHLVFAGSDIILCQSFHDVTLEVPIKALKYGAAPIALTSNDNRLRQFVDHDHETTRFSRFINSTFGHMSLDQALDEINVNPSKWNQKITDAMAKDFSWDAECYEVHVSAYSTVKNL